MFQTGCQLVVIATAPWEMRKLDTWQEEWESGGA